MLERANKKPESLFTWMLSYPELRLFAHSGPVSFAGKCLLTHCVITDRLTQLGDYTHSATFDNSYQAEVLAKFAVEDRHWKKIFVVGSADCAYWQDLGQTFVKNF